VERRGIGGEERRGEEECREGGREEKGIVGVDYRVRVGGV
jgi:hypothetical protein